MIRWSLIIAAILFCLSSFGQEQIKLKGIVTADSLEGIAINIINLSQKRGTTNTESGLFEIEVKENDTLQFSSVQYELFQVVITPNILNEQFLAVHLRENINQLNEVKISNSILTGNLRQDISNVVIFSQKDIGFPLSSKKPLTPIERKLISARAGPLITLLNTLNGTLEMLNKAKENEVLSIIVKQGVEIFSTALFVKDFNIPEERIIDFVYFCARNEKYEDLLKSKNRLELLEYFQQEAKEYLNHGSKKRSAANNI